MTLTLDDPERIVESNKDRIILKDLDNQELDEHKATIEIYLDDGYITRIKARQYRPSVRKWNEIEATNFNAKGGEQRKKKFNELHRE
jgi:hypothetical protein